MFINEGIGLMRVHIGAWAAAFDEEGILWLSDFNYNGLYRYDIKTREMNLVHRFEGVSLAQDALHKEMRILGDEILLFPLWDNRIRVYNKKTGKENFIELPVLKNHEYDTWIVDDKKALLFSNYANVDILCYEFKTKKLYADTKLNDICMSLVGRKDETIKKGAFDNTLILHSEKRRELYCLNLETYTYEVINIQNIKEDIYKIYFIDNIYWFTLKDSHDLYAYKEGVFIRYNAEVENYVEGKNSIPYSNLVQWGEELILLNYNGKTFMRISKKDKVLENLFAKEEITLSENIDYGACYQTALQWNNSLYFIPQRGICILECDDKMNLINKYECIVNINEESINELLSAAMSKRKNLMENNEITSLQRYMKSIGATVIQEKKENLGKNIYLKLKAMEEVW